MNTLYAYLLVLLLVLVPFLYALYKTYHLGCQAGERKGFGKGFQHGLAKGRRSGQVEGRRSGYQMGKLAVFERGAGLAQPGEAVDADELSLLQGLPGAINAREIQAKRRGFWAWLLGR